jgi:Cu+-exporting ATPase
MTQTINFTITGEQKLHCAGCEQQVGTALQRVPGIQDVRPSAQKQQIMVTIDPAHVTPEQVREKLAQLGYEVAPGDGAPAHQATVANETHLPAEAVGRNGSAKLHMKVGGMHCSLCTESIRKTLGRLDGVQDVQVSIAHQETLVEYDPTRISPRLIEKNLEDIGYSIHAPDAAEIFAQEEHEPRGARRKAVLAGVLLLAASGLMLTALLAGPSLPGTLTMGALALFAALGPARFIIMRNGWQSIRRGILNQDVLVSASALGGLIGGIVGLLIPAVPAGGFFGATVFVLAFHLIGGYVSVGVHVRASQSVRQLLALEPQTVRRVEANGDEVAVPLEHLAVGDHCSRTTG